MRKALRFALVALAFLLVWERGLDLLHDPAVAAQVANQVQLQHFGAQYSKIAPGNYQMLSATATGAAATVTVPAVSGQTNYLIMAIVSCTAASAPGQAPFTITGLLGGTMTVEVTANTTPVIIPMMMQQASASNVALVGSITAPASHTCAVSLQSFTD